MEGGGSAKAICHPKSLLLTEYPQSSDCTGQAVPNEQPINKCLKDTQGSYFENTCSSTSADVTVDAVLKRM